MRRISVYTIFILLITILGILFVFWGKNVHRAPDFSCESGVYEEDFYLEMKAGIGSRIYYTTDGSDPDENSTLYEGPVLLTDASGEPNRISSREDLSAKAYDAPSSNVDKANVIKAIAFYGSDLKSEIVTGNFLVKKSDEAAGYKACPVLFLIADPAELTDYNHGIMVLGSRFDEYVKAQGITEEEIAKGEFKDYSIEANFSSRMGRNAERIVNAQLVSEDVIFDMNVGIRNRGVSSSDGPKKSYNLYAREEYGTAEFPKELFSCGHEVDRLTLRREDSILKDALAEEMLAGSPLLVTEAGSPVQVFINGEYWGLYDLEEKYDENWFMTHLGISGDKIDLVKGRTTELNATGSAKDDLKALFEYCETHDLSVQENYEYVLSKVNIESYADFYATIVYIASIDFSQDYNLIFWRTSGNLGEGSLNGKWNWSVYDLNSAMINPEQDTLNGELKKGYENPIGEHTMLSALMKNENFREIFAKSFERMEEYFSADEVRTAVENKRDALTAAGEKNNLRWDEDVDYDAQADKIINFFDNRKTTVDEAVKQYFERFENN